MTEDILEQLVDGWFKRKPSVFTKHNVKYRPDIANMKKDEKKKYSVHSDIDVLGVDLSSAMPEVFVVNCKSWQGGLDVEWWYNILSNKNNHIDKKSGKQHWKPFREITNDIWAEAFRNKIFEETHSMNFTYYIAATRLDNKQMLNTFKTCSFFLDKLKGRNKNAIVKIEFLSLADMVDSIMKEIKTTTIESSEIGRFLQLLKAANLKISE